MPFVSIREKKQNARDLHKVHINKIPQSRLRDPSEIHHLPFTIDH
jgi:hypothetical protein